MKATGLLIACLVFPCVAASSLSCSSGDGSHTPYDAGEHGTGDDTDTAVEPWGDLPPDVPRDVQNDMVDMAGDQDECTPPHALIILDRTMSMHRETGGRPKWLVALDAISLMLSNYTDTIWWGLELFPRDHDACVTLEERISGVTAENPQCEEGEVYVAPGPGTADAINTKLDETLLCRSTPVEKAVDVAVSWFGAHPPDIADRKQVTVIITDGQETCDGQGWCSVTTLLSMGIKSFVIGFGDEVDPHDLSSMACAGGTAPDPTQCNDSDPGCVSAVSGDPPQFYFAEDPDSFQAAIDEIAAAIECGVLI
jgi:hypothetical protein